MEISKARIVQEPCKDEAKFVPIRLVNFYIKTFSFKKFYNWKFFMKIYNDSFYFVVKFENE